MLYLVYDSEFANVIQPVVQEVCNKNITNADKFSKHEHDKFKKVFELYNEIRKFAYIGMEYCPVSPFKTKDFDQWFMVGVNIWMQYSYLSDIFR